MHMEVGVKSGTQYSFLIEPNDGVSIWQALADANPQGFVRVEVYPDMTARVVVHEEGDGWPSADR